MKRMKKMLLDRAAKKNATLHRRGIICTEIIYQFLFYQSFINKNVL